VSGILGARLRGPKGADWDLAVVDAASGRVLAASLGFGSREVVSAPVAGADRVQLRVCRRKGAGRSATLELAYATLPQPVTAERVSLVEVDITSPGDQKRLEAAGIDTADHSDGRTLKLMLYSPDDLATVVRLGYAPRTLIADVTAQDRRERLAERRREMTGRRSPIPSGRTTYRTLADHQADMKDLAEKHPDVARGVVLPVPSLEGREISGIEIATDVKRTDDGRPHYYIDGVNHAREWPGGEIPTEFAIELVKNPTGSPRLAAIRDNARTLVVPIINVDGFDASRTVGEAGVFETANFGDLPWAATGTGVSYTRKNCRHGDQTAPPEPGVCIANKMAADLGVDTNRNYGFGWGGPGAGTNFASLTYRGSAPFSEPETTSLRKFMNGLQPSMVIANHTVAALMLRPPGQQETPDTPDEGPMKALGDLMAKHSGLKSQRSWELYDTTGTTIDWTYGAMGTWSYTPELGGTGFHGEHPEHVVEQYTGTGEHGGMREALTLAGEAAVSTASHSVITGRAPAGRTLRVSRPFAMKTWDGEALDPDTHTTSITVPASGVYEWHVTPSRRPYEASGAWTLTCENNGAVVETREVAVERGQRVTVDLPCGGGEAAPKPAAACLDVLGKLRVRARGRGIAVSYGEAGGRVTVEVLRGKRRVARVSGGRRAATLKRLANGRYRVKVSARAADGRTDVRSATLTKRGKRVKVGRTVRAGC
jgi:hypothetical protein